MKNRNFLNSIAFFLLALMLLKVSSLHTYTHKDSCEIEECKSCELATEIQDNDHLAVTPAVFKTSFFSTYTHVPTVFYELVLSSSFLYPSFFGRPPPYVG